MFCGYLAVVLLTLYPNVRSMSPMTDVNPVQTLSAWALSHDEILLGYNASLVAEIATSVYPTLLKWSSNDKERKFNDCQRSFYNLSLSLLKRDPAAIRVVDSMGKIESGLLTGNIRWTGRYSQCVESDSLSMQTKWCIFSIGGNQKEKVQLTTDASVSIGLCIPQPCSEDTLNDAVSHLTAFTNISVQIKCPIQPTVWMGVDIFSMIIVVALVVLLGIGTCAEVYCRSIKRQIDGGVTSSVTDLSGKICQKC